MPIFRVKSVKIYTGIPVAPVTNIRYAASPATLVTRVCVGEQVWATRSAVKCVVKRTLSQSMLENQEEICLEVAASMLVISRRKE